MDQQRNHRWAFGHFIRNLFRIINCLLSLAKGLSQMPAGRAAFFFYLDPISGAILAIILLGEKITTGLIVGGILITAAVILAEFKRKAHPLYK